MSNANDSKQFIGSAPYFVVRDVLKSVEYYHKCLGFNEPTLWGEPPSFAMPARDGFIFMLKEADDGHAITTNRDQTGYWDAYVWINDADALFTEMKANGAIIEYEPTIRDEYGMKEFAVRDIDGYVIAFGQDTES